MVTNQQIVLDDSTIEQAIIEAVNQTNLRPLQKVRYLNLMRSPFRRAVRQRIVDQAKIGLLDSGEFELRSDGTLAVGSFASIIEIMIKLLPVILSLLELFS